MISTRGAVGLAMLSLSLTLAGCFTPEDDSDAPSCPEYCELIQDHCQGDIAQYPGTAVCEATCSFMDRGAAEDELGNTVGCRIHHSLLASESPDPHCFHAGPGGDGTCGGNCESFCSLAMSVCTGGNAQYASAEACISACNSFASEPPFSTALEDADTFACRLEHVSLAALDPSVHCPHIAVDSPVCSN